MLKSYSTLVSASEGYPFVVKDDLLPNFQYDVQIKLSIKDSSLHDYTKRFKKILDLQLLCRSLIRLNKIVHDKTQNEFILIYEFVPFSLSEIYQLKIQMNKIQTKIHQICQFLLHKRIRPVISAKNFGFSQNKELKYLLLPDFQEITDQNELSKQFDSLQKKINYLFKNLKPPTPLSPRQTVEDDKTSLRVSERDLSVYKKKFEEKISLIQSKLLMNKQGTTENKLSSSQKLKKRKKFSQNLTEQSASVSSSSSNSLRVQQSRSRCVQYISSNSFKNSYQENNSATQKEKYYIKSSAPLGQKSSSQQDRQSPQQIPSEKPTKLTNSLIIEEKNEEMQKLKQHKSSFGDYSNYGNEIQKEKKLKRRISFALEKSQNALKVYEKYQSMRHTHLSVAKK